MSRSNRKCVHAIIDQTNIIFNNFNDVDGQYNVHLDRNNIALWISPGYNGIEQAVYLPSTNYSTINHSLDLTNTSFTFSAWIWIPNWNN